MFKRDGGQLTTPVTFGNYNCRQSGVLIVAHHTDQIIALSTDQIHALSTWQVVAMTTTDLAHLTADQVAAMTTGDLHALNVSGNCTYVERSSLDFLQSQALGTTPIVLDLGGTGIQTVNAAHGVNFDMAAAGQLQHVGWITGQTGFLVRDVNNDGIIDNGSEMFGSSTTLATGGKASNGFDALRSFDANHDGVINSHDAVYNQLKVWVDANHDGISQAAEMHSLQSLGISQLNLNATHTSLDSSGNLVGLNSTYTTVSGQTHQMADVWFQSNAQIDVTTLSTAQIVTLTTDQIHTLTTDQIHTFTTDQIVAMTPDQVAAFSTADIASLSQDQVKHMTLDDVAALHNFGKDDVFSAQQMQAFVKPHLAVSAFDDVVFSGNVHFHANVTAGIDQLQLIVTGDTTGKVELIGQHGDWKDAGAMLVNGAESHVYNNGHTQIVIQGSVLATPKDLLV